MQKKPRILIITTSAATMTDSDKPTGLWLEELTTPYYAFLDAGAEVTLASIAGGKVPVDPNSVKPRGENDPSVERAMQDRVFQTLIGDTLRFDTLDTTGFDAIMLPGGHGTMFDYPESAELAKLVDDARDGLRRRPRRLHRGGHPLAQAQRRRRLTRTPAPAGRPAPR